MKFWDKLIYTVALCLAVSGGAVAFRLIAPVAMQTNAPPPEAVELPAAQEFAGEVSVPIIMYHHVLEAAGRLNEFTISPAELKQDLQYLKDQGYQTVTMQDLIAFTYDGAPLPQKPIMLTFDDGYESFYEYVYPLLKEYDCKVVYSVIGIHVDEYSKMDEHKVLYSHTTWEQLREMMESGLVEVQNHSYNLHKGLGQGARHGAKMIYGEDPDSYRLVLEEDLMILQARCLQELSWTPTAFAYPFGQISKQTLPILKDMGFTGALTCEERVNVLTGDPEELYHLGRYNRPHGTSAEQILLKAK